MYLLIVEWGAGGHNISGPKKLMKIDDWKISRSIDDNRLIITVGQSMINR